MTVSRESVLAWVAGYEHGWREGDPTAVDRLFTEDVAYRHSPYAEPLVGHAAVASDWVDPTGFTLSASVIAVDGDRAVVRAEVHYLGAETQEYRDLWLLTFAADGRVQEFEEWAYWPGLHYTPDGGR